jgi:putative nucleotidyltransferase with HDIG domain
MNLALSTLIDKSTTLVSLPEVFLKINELINDPRSSATDIGHVIEQDAALTARLLKIVNSPYYGFPSSINTISRAITIIGIRDLRDLVLATTTVKALEGLDNELLSLDKFWRHSLYSAVTARILASQRNDKNVERLFVAGLLHDIGTLVMYQGIPELCNETIQQAHQTQTPLHMVEREIIGFDHTEVGAELARRWKLPENIIETIRYHHNPLAATENPVDVAVVHIANFIANSIDEASNRSGNIDPVIPETWGITGLSLDVIDTALYDVTEKFNEMYRLLLPSEKAA